jgi:phosphatidate cytidylyltransferase
VAKSGSAQSSAEAPPATEASQKAPRRFDRRRVYTAAILIPAIYAIIRYLPPWAFTVLIIAGGGIAVIELYRISFGQRMNAYAVGWGLAATTMIIGRAHFEVPLADIVMLAVITLASAMIFSSTPIKDRFNDTCVMLFGVLYVGLTLSTLVLTRTFPAGEFFILFVALVTWAGDTGAYYSGNLWGRRLLAPTVSPKKTVEGLFGGMALACATAFLAQTWFLPQIRVMDALVLGVLLTVAGLLGDLSESALKRSVGVKDSGGILPGHGGMLDRLDSLLFTAPAFYYYAVCVRGLAPLQ